MQTYEHLKIESKWQEYWDSNQTFRTPNIDDIGFDKTKSKYYILDMFPYPSGSGLHVGHAAGYIGSDIIARRKRMEGYNVLHPMGWDAFGLPAEQYAIQTGQHPGETTAINSTNFKRQLKLIGLSYDWSREINTSDPSYYKWTQWLFIKFYEKGLVYQKEEMVWWCEDLKTVLANEEVINGRSERGNYPCIRKPLNQWMVRITSYADRLLDDLKLLDWPTSVKKMQEEWIGKSEGAEIQFSIVNLNEKITVYTTRPEIIFGISAIVLSPEYSLVSQIADVKKKAEVSDYIRVATRRSEKERQAEIENISGVFTGRYVQHPFLHTEIPIYIADYVLNGYGTGAIMAVPAHDERDQRFSELFNLISIQVIKEGQLVNSEFLNNKTIDEARLLVLDEIEKQSIGKRSIKYRLRDWLFSRQRYWGEPFPLSYRKDGSVVASDENDLPIILPEMKDFTPSSDGSSPLARAREWVDHVDYVTGEKLKRVTDTMPGWAASCWYYLRFMDPQNTQQSFSKEAVEYWNEVDVYIGGAAHAVMHLLYARFFHKVLFDLGIVPHPEPFKKLFNQGMITAYAYKDATDRLVPSDQVEQRDDNFYSMITSEKVQRFVTKMAKSLKNVTSPDDVIRKYGADTLRLYEMFMGPLDAEKPWSSEGITGSYRFIQRFWNQITKNILSKALSNDDDSPHFLKIERGLSRCIKRIDDSFINYNFNTAVAAGMEFLNLVNESGGEMTLSQVKRFILIMSPLMPHVCEELWQMLGNSESLAYETWPIVDEKYLEEESYELVIQQNGKLKKRVTVQKGLSERDLKNIAYLQLGITDIRSIKKTIIVPDRLVNVVV